MSKIEPLAYGVFFEMCSNRDDLGNIYAEHDIHTLKNLKRRVMEDRGPHGSVHPYKYKSRNLGN
jgi:hypothetical protein